MRANQGHGDRFSGCEKEILSKIDWTEFADDSFCVHATFFRAWSGIKEQGIIPGGQEGRRAHTHLTPSSSLQTMPHLARRNSDVLIFFNVADLQHAADIRGMDFFMSTNGYILTKHVLSSDLMFLVYDVRRDRPLKDLRGIVMPQELEDAMSTYYDWYHGGFNPDPDYRDEPGPFEPPSTEKTAPQDEELRHEVVCPKGQRQVKEDPRKDQVE